MESIWARAFNSFGFIALLVCIAVLLTTISSSIADQRRNPPSAVLQLVSPDAALLANIRVGEAASRPRH